MLIGLHRAGSHGAQGCQRGLRLPAALDHQAQQDHARAPLPTITMQQDAAATVKNTVKPPGQRWPVRHRFRRAEIAHGKGPPGDIHPVQKRAKIADVVALHLVLRGHRHDDFRVPFGDERDIGQGLAETARQRADPKPRVVVEFYGFD